ncbi:MAG: hypothetical protein IJ213_06675 [Bacteroidales bacterium]|nr:hypothetical protein [Bacteroidales bacterium]
MRFSQVKGQIFLTKQIRDIIDNGRLAHALLLTGKDGYGSLAIALSIAQYVSCTNKKEEDSCGECPSCNKYQKLIHPDLHFIFPTTTITKVDKNPSSSAFISQFRDFVLQTEGYGDLNSWLNFIGGEKKQGIINVRDADEVLSYMNIKTYESKYKIVIVWHADRLNTEASNKLLKVLEEPYPNTFFILTAERKDKILPTILSRLQQINLTPLDLEVVKQHVEQLNPSLSEQEINNIVLLSDGDLTKTTSEYFTENEDFLRLFVTVNRLAMAYKKNAIEILKQTDDMSKMTREELKHFSNFFLKTIENCWLYNSGCTFIQHPLETTEDKFKKNYPKFITQNNLEGIYNLMEKFQYNVDRNANAKINIFNMIIKLGMLLEKR